MAKKAIKIGNLINTCWSIRNLDDESAPIEKFTFAENGLFKSKKVYPDGSFSSNDLDKKYTWKLNDKLITISYNNGYMIKTGKINDEFNLIEEGRYENKKGLKGKWVGKLLDESNKRAISKIQNSLMQQNVDKTKIFRCSLLQYIRNKVKEDLNNQTYKETVSHKQADWIEINKTIVRVEDVDTNADNYNSEETEIIEVCLGDILEVWLYDIKSHRGSIFTQYINTDDLEDWMDTSKKVSIKEIEEWINSSIRSLYHYFEEEIYLDSDDVGDIYLQIQYPNFSLKDLNPDWDDDEYFLDDEKLENFINDII